MHRYELHLDNFKGDFLNFLHPRIKDIQIVVYRTNIVRS